MKRTLIISLLFLAGGVLAVNFWLADSAIESAAAGISTQQGSGPQKIIFSDIAHAYHGLLLDRDFKEIKLDRAVIEQLQDSMIESLAAQPDTTEYKGFKPQITKPPLDQAYVAKILTGFKFTDDERIVIKSIIIQQGIDAAPSQEQGEYQWRLNLINERSVFHMNGKTWTSQSEFNSYLTQINLAAVLDRIRIRLRPDPTYLDTCRANQVPIPPDWPTGGWHKLMPNLPFRYNFLGRGPDTEVWTYEPPNLASGEPPPDQGLCYALPRMTGAYATLVGIICQSKRTLKACFWDNLPDPSTGQSGRLEGKDLVLPISDLQNGANLAENCTDCHRGGNAFLIHPNTALGQPLNRNPDVRYTPIGQPTWSNPPAFAPVGAGECSSCHEIAEPTSDYCRILTRAADLTMPNDRFPAGWNPPSAVPAFGTPEYRIYLGYRSHIAYLKTRCP